MARKRDTPCSVCGEVLWSGTGSVPAERRTCQPCRRTLGEFARASKGFVGLPAFGVPDLSKHATLKLVVKAVEAILSLPSPAGPLHLESDEQTVTAFLGATFLFEATRGELER